MYLEVITHQPKSQSGLKPLLFIHGGCHGAWCWENFLPYFAEHGYEAHAMSLRGHGASEGHERIRWIRTREYLEDISNVIDRLPTAPVLIGHSVGGYVVQKYLEEHTVPAVVLLNSVPVTGMFKMLLRLAVRHPWQALKFHLTWNPYAAFETPSLAREAFFSDDMPTATINRHFARLENESYVAGLEATFFDLPRPKKVLPIPMLILGADNDALFSRDEIEATARAYKTQAEFFPNMAHSMMLEAGWQSVAVRILKWLRENRL